MVLTVLVKLPNGKGYSYIRAGLAVVKRPVSLRVGNLMMID